MAFRWLFSAPPDLISGCIPTGNVGIVRSALIRFRKPPDVVVFLVHGRAGEQDLWDVWQGHHMFTANRIHRIWL